jgi:hypothetical protein
MFGLILNVHLYGNMDKLVEVSYLGEYNDLVSRKSVDPEREEASWPRGGIVPHAEILVESEHQLGTLKAHVCSLKSSHTHAAGMGGAQ